MLTIELELLNGVYRASLPDGSGAEWPPHPERLFSALVQAWGDGGRLVVERDALEWLERQPAPEIEADVDHVSYRSAPDVYVPPNDVSGTKLEALPLARKGQPRKFWTATPPTPLVRYQWPDAQPNETQRCALEALSARTSRVGHSSSLVRLYVRRDDVTAHDMSVWRPAEFGRHRIRVPHPGRLEALERFFQALLPQRPQTGVTAFYQVAETQRSTAIGYSDFGGENDWFVFAADETNRFRPDILGFSRIAHRVRAALMSHCEVQPCPELISGHGSPNKPSLKPHMAVVPLMNAGFEHSDGELLGFGVVLPRDLRAEDRQPALRALASFAGVGSESALAKLHLGRDSTWLLKHIVSQSMHSLRPRRYCESSRVWASVTPVLLDRHLKHSDPRAEAELIGHSCEHIGLPAPIDIEIHKHSSLRGAPPAYLSRHTRVNWSFASDALAGRPRRHVVLRFETPVAGPVILGAGRHQGFGLCLPLERSS